MSALSPAATAALWAYTATALEQQANPSFSREGLLPALLEPLRAVDGTWSDVEDLIALDEPALPFLNEHHARTVWAVHGGEFPLFDEQVAA